MKFFLKTTAFLILTILFMSCEEDLTLSSLPVESGTSIYSPSFISKINLEPCGDPLILQNALDQAVERGGRTNIYLGPGVYVIEPTDITSFYGSIIGAGADKTIIKSITGIDCQKIANQDIWPSLLKFRLGDVTLKNFTLQIDEIPCKELWAPITTPNNLNKYLGAVVMICGNTYSEDNLDQYEVARSYIENIQFKGIIDEEGFTSVDNHIILGAEIPNNVDLVKSMDGGNHVIRNSRFETADAAIQIHYTDNTFCSMINNTFRDIQFTSGLFYDCSHSYIEFHQNDILQNNGLAAVFNSQYFLAGILDAGYQETSHFSFHKNEIKTNNIPYGIIFDDPRFVNQNEKSMAVHCRKNNIEANLCYTAMIALGSKNGLFLQNSFLGEGSYSCYLDYADNSSFIHNDFSNFMANQANMYLGPATSRCKVVGLSDDKVIDEGSDNIIVAGRLLKRKKENSSRMNPGYGLSDHLRLQQKR